MKLPGAGSGVSKYVRQLLEKFSHTLSKLFVEKRKKSASLNIVSTLRITNSGASPEELFSIK